MHRDTAIELDRWHAAQRFMLQMLESAKVAIAAGRAADAAVKSSCVAIRDTGRLEVMEGRSHNGHAVRFHEGFDQLRHLITPAPVREFPHAAEYRFALILPDRGFVVVGKQDSRPRITHRGDRPSEPLGINGDWHVLADATGADIVRSMIHSDLS